VAVEVLAVALGALVAVLAVALGALVAVEVLAVALGALVAPPDALDEFEGRAVLEGPDPVFEAFEASFEVADVGSEFPSFPTSTRMPSTTAAPARMAAAFLSGVHRLDILGLLL
jgi:hypothetical protein